MLVAQLHGKLASDMWLGSEDLLTSAIFGTLKNVSPEVFIDLVHSAKSIDGTSGPLLSTPLDWTFWPWWDTCEPDVVIEDANNICVLEAKLYSDFGEESLSGTQLSREWSDGMSRAVASGRELWLLAVTNHARVPEAAIRKQLALSTAQFSRVCWLSWSDIGTALQRADEFLGPWQDDLLELLMRMGLAPFDGFQAPPKAAISFLDSASWASHLAFGGEEDREAGFKESISIAVGLPQTIESPWQLVASRTTRDGSQGGNVP